MNKLFTKIATAFVGIAMAIGVGVAVGSHSDFKSAEAAEQSLTPGAGQILYTHDFSTKPTASADNTLAETKTTPQDSVVWTAGSASNLNSYNSANYKGVQLGAKGKTGSFSLETKNIWGSQTGTYKDYTVIKKIALFLNNGNGTISATVKVGGTSCTSSGSVSKNSSAVAQRDGTSKVEYTPNANSNTGKINIAYSATSGGGYFCSIQVLCEKPSYTVSFDVNTSGYGTVSPNSISNVPSGSTISTSGNKITINGTTVTATPTASTAQYTYAFTGWSNNAGTIDASRTITANFSRTLNQVTVSGSVTGGSLDNTDSINYGGDLYNQIKPDDGYTYPDDEDITIMMGSTDITASAYDSSDGSILYEGVTGNIVITASCRQVGSFCTVSYNANSGTVSPSSEQIVVGGHPTFPIPSRDGFNFKGWQIGGSGTAYFNPEDYTVSTDVTFVASWLTAFTVSFNSSGGSITPSQKTIDSGATFTFPSAGTKAHYSFDGWTSTGSAPYYAVGATSPAVTGNITYTAHWTEDAKYTVTYVAGTHGTGSFTYGTSYYSGESHTLLSFADLSGITIADPTSYRFKDFTVGENTKLPNETIEIGTSNVTITVNFEEIPEEYNVMFDFSKIDFEDWTASYAGQYHEIEYSQGNVEFNDCALPNSDQPIHDIPVTKGGTIEFIAAEGIEISEATFALRQWNAKTKTVELLYSTDGGQNYTTTEITSDTFSISSNSLPTGTNALKISFSETSNQVGIESLSIVYTGGTAPTIYTIQYNANGGTGEMASTSGSAPQVASCTFTAPAGMEFSSWNDDPNGEGEEYQVDQVVTADVTLYAIWSESSGDVSEYFTKITSTSDIKNDGKYLIVYGDLCFDGSLETLDQTGNTADATLSNLLTSYFTIDVSSGAIKSASNLYIGNASDSNALTTSDSPLSNTISFDDDGNLVVQSSGGAYLRYNKTSGQERFRYFKSSTYTSQQPIQLYKVNISKYILSNITCNSAGTSVPTGSWSNLVSYYNTLSSDDKAAFGEVIASKTGTQVEQAMAKYDYIIGKYNPEKITDPTKTNFVHFITSRSPAKIGSGMIAINSIITNSTNTSIIVIVTVGIAAIAIGGYFLLRKKKED